jgi:AcrR family transcriptional regulator
LSDEIGYSQPVLYTHYANKAAIVGAVALDGFREITQLLQDAKKKAVESAESLRRVAEAYLSFAAEQPSLYVAMFTLSADLRFDETDTDPILRDAFSALAAVVSPFTPDPDIATEFVWSTLHGLAELERTGRIKPGGRSKRIEMLVRSLAEHSRRPRVDGRGSDLATAEGPTAEGPTAEGHDGRGSRRPRVRRPRTAEGLTAEGQT